MSTPDHWNSAASLWPHLGPPLRPSPEDVHAFQLAVNAASHATPLRVLVLGVTPELHNLSWPHGTTLTAADHTQAMIDAIWPGPRGSAILAEWIDLPLADHSIDLVLCDGGVHLLDFPHAQARLAASLRRILTPHGQFIARLFVPPATRESPAAVLNDLREGRIESVNALKLRLAHTMQPDAATGIRVRDVWYAVRDAIPDWPALATRLGWSAAQQRTIEVYDHSEARYHFVTADDLLHLWGRDSWTAEAVASTSRTYPFADRCPVIRFRPRG